PSGRIRAGPSAGPPARDRCSASRIRRPGTCSRVPPFAHWRKKPPGGAVTENRRVGTGRRSRAGSPGARKRSSGLRRQDEPVVEEMGEDRRVQAPRPVPKPAPRQTQGDVRDQGRDEEMKDAERGGGEENRLPRVEAPRQQPVRRPPESQFLDDGRDDRDQEAGPEKAAPPVRIEGRRRGEAE